MAAEIKENISPTDILGLMRNTLIRMANQNSVPPSKVQVKIYYDHEISALGYWLYLNGNKARKMSFLTDVIAKKADSMNRETILNMVMLNGFMGAKPVIQKWATEFNLEYPSVLYLMICSQDDDPVNPILLLYSDAGFLRQVFVKEFI